MTVWQVSLQEIPTTKITSKSGHHYPKKNSPYDSLHIFSEEDIKYEDAMEKTLNVIRQIDMTHQNEHFIV